MVQSPTIIVTADGEPPRFPRIWEILNRLSPGVRHVWGGNGMGEDGVENGNDNDDDDTRPTPIQDFLNRVRDRLNDSRSE